MGQKTGMLKKEKNVQNRAINDARVSDSLKLCACGGCVCGGVWVGGWGKEETEAILCKYLAT